MPNKPDVELFYSLAFLNTQRETAVKENEWGNFISPSKNIPLSSPTNKKTINTDLSYYASQSPHFAEIARVLQNHLSDYYSAKYLFDCASILQKHVGTIQKLVEVSPKFGDLSCLFAETSNHMDIAYDIVDTDKNNLLNIYEKIQSLFPQAINRVRLFFGDLPIYIKKEIISSPVINLIHYQSQNFNDAVKDLAATFHARNNIFGTIVHGTHMRTTNMQYHAFVDAALYAIFGKNMQFLKLGEEATHATEPDVQHNPPRYYASNRVDGMYVPYSKNIFHYPHPDSELDAFLYQSEQG